MTNDKEKGENSHIYYNSFHADFSRTIVAAMLLDRGILEILAKNSDIFLDN